MLSLKPHSDLALLYNQFNNTSPDKNNDPENAVNSKYSKFSNIHKSLALFHIDACSLNKKFNDLECTNKFFDIIALSETRITKQTSLSTNISMRNYAIEFTPTKSSAGGTHVYIASHLSYKTCTDLHIYKTKQLESTFFEIFNPKKSNIVILLSLKISKYGFS